MRRQSRLQGLPRFRPDWLGGLTDGNHKANHVVLWQIDEGRNFLVFGRAASIDGIDGIHGEISGVR